MKARHYIARLAGLSATLALVLAAAGCASSGSNSTRRVYEERKFIPLYHVRNTADEMNLEKGDAIAMACTKCKSVLYANVDKARTRFFVPLGHRHYCPGCKSTITVAGSGFKLKEEVKHACEACG